MGGVLLLVFSISITPKKYLHDAIANHKDKTALTAVGNDAQLTHTGFVCKCDNLVAESPFTNEVQHLEFAQAAPVSIQQASLLYHFYSTDVFFFELRGPPVPVL